MDFIIISPSEKMHVRARWLFDGQSLLPGEGYTLTIKEGIIRQIQPTQLKSQPESNVLDFNDCFILPALVDCHVHLALDGMDFIKSLASWDQPGALTTRIQEQLRAFLSAGIAAVRDGGDQKGIGLKTKQHVAETMNGPIVHASGPAIRKKGRYGSFLGPDLVEGSIEEYIHTLIDLGADHIKVLVSGLVSFKTYGQVGDLLFNQEELNKIVSTAHTFGVKVMAHASSDQAVQMAIEAGVDSLEHGYFMHEKTLELLAHANIPWVPTIVPVANQIKGEIACRYSGKEIEIINKTYRRHQQLIKKGAELGVRIGVGTDSGAVGVPHGKSFIDELLLMEEAGLSRQTILRAATQEGASILGLGKEMGRIAPGYKPYLLVVKGNPNEDLRHLSQIQSMILPSGG